MKTILLVVLSLCMSNAFSNEISYQLTNKNIAEISSVPSESCAIRPKSSLRQKASHTTVITLTTGEVLNLVTFVEYGDSCRNVIARANTKGLSVTNALKSILNDDLTFLPVQNNLICQKTIAYVVFDSETKIASNFHTKLIAVKCQS